MRMITVLGTRPEIIRLNLIIKKPDRLSKRVPIHTDRNYSGYPRGIFFKKPGLRRSDYILKAGTGGFGSGAATPGSQEEGYAEAGLRDKAVKFVMGGAGHV
jgi:UDP-N-acetylglucosamine 2-epimerase (non-hydrolysing)